ncbi:MAG: hypothetical protein AAF628_13795 [Planctomycetota bacterium]
MPLRVGATLRALGRKLSVRSALLPAALFAITALAPAQQLCQASGFATGTGFGGVGRHFSPGAVGATTQLIQSIGLDEVYGDAQTACDLANSMVITTLSNAVALLVPDLYLQLLGMGCTPLYWDYYESFQFCWVTMRVEWRDGSGNLVHEQTLGWLCEAVQSGIQTFGADLAGLLASMTPAERQAFEQLTVDVWMSCDIHRKIKVTAYGIPNTPPV